MPAGRQNVATGQWRGTTDGTPFMHRALIWLLRFIPLWVVYLLMAFSLPVYMIARPRNSLAIWHYFRRRQGFGFWKTFCHLWKNHFLFGQVVVDRFAAYAGRKFEIEVVGHNHYREIEASGCGFMMISSHIGNHEMAGYDLKARARLNVLAYGGEVEAVRSGRNRLLAENNIRMVPITDGISHIFVLREALQSGEVVDIHGDRLFGSPKSFECSVLGAPARLPQGPFVLATSVEVPAGQGPASDLVPSPLPVIAVFCVKTGYRHFKVFVHRLDDAGLSPEQGVADSAASLSPRERAKALADRYAAAMSEILRTYPDQWFNFFEFWK